MSSTTLHYLGTNPITIKGFGWINATQAAQMSKGKVAEEWLTSSGGLYALEQLAGELGAGFVPGFFDLHRVQGDKKNFMLEPGLRVRPLLRTDRAFGEKPDTADAPST